jgi:hypothetical protein
MQSCVLLEYAATCCRKSRQIITTHLKVVCGDNRFSQTERDSVSNVIDYSVVANPTIFLINDFDAWQKNSLRYRSESPRG